MPGSRAMRRRRQFHRRPVRRPPAWWRPWLWAAICLGIVLLLLQSPEPLGDRVQAVIGTALTASPDLGLGQWWGFCHEWRLALPVLGEIGTDARWTELKGNMIFPVTGTVSSEFGWRRLPSGELEFHEGIDIIVDGEREVRAAADGIVTAVRTSPLYGLVVDIDHGRGMTTRYGRLADVAVRSGQAVTAGAIIGQASPEAGGLHFELRYRDVAIDPLDWFPTAGGQTVL